jgi:hypothetical protein
MIRFDDKRPQRLALAAGAAVLVVAAAAWWFNRPASGAASDGAAAGSAAAQAASGTAFPWARAGASGAARPPLAALDQTAADGRPSFITAEEWSALQETLKDHPQREQEMNRIVTYLRFQKEFESWQALRESSDTAQRQALAQRLLDQVPSRVAKREVTAGEAVMLQAALLEDLVADPAQREQRLAQERQRLEQAPTSEEAQAMAREERQLRDFEQRQASIVAQWQAMPAEQRDQKWLDAQLEAARRAAFSSR